MADSASQAQEPATEDVLIIEAGSLSFRLWGDLWRYRGLFFVLAWRDISVRYKQTVVGLAWAIVRPVVTMVVFTVIFGGLAGLPSEASAPYALLVFAALLPWNLFSTGLAAAGNSIIGNASLIGKVYFPRIIIPASAIMTAVVEFAIGLLILFVLMIWYGYVPGWQILLLPVFAMMAALAALGPGLYLATMTAKYRDFHIAIPFALQFGLYISPVGFSSALVPEPWRLLFSLNPLTGIIDGFRWCILGGERGLDWQSISIAAIMIAVALWLGFVHFRKSEGGLVDVI